MNAHQYLSLMCDAHVREFIYIEAMRMFIEGTIPNMVSRRALGLKSTL